MSHHSHPCPVRLQSGSGKGCSPQSPPHSPRHGTYSGHLILPRYSQSAPVLLLWKSFRCPNPSYNKDTCTGQSVRGKWNGRWTLSAKAAVQTRNSGMPHKSFPLPLQALSCSSALSVTVLSFWLHLCSLPLPFPPNPHTGLHNG